MRFVADDPEASRPSGLRGTGPMPTLVDTSVLIDALRGDPSATTYLATTRRSDTIVSVTPVRTEILGACATMRYDGRSTSCG